MGHQDDQGVSNTLQQRERVGTVHQEYTLGPIIKMKIASDFTIGYRIFFFLSVTANQGQELCWFAPGKIPDLNSSYKWHHYSSLWKPLSFFKINLAFGPITQVSGNVVLISTITPRESALLLAYYFSLAKVVGIVRKTKLKNMMKMQSPKFKIRTILQD